MTETTGCYLALSPNYWGRGTTPEEAKKKLREAGGSTRDKWVLIRVDGDATAEVDGLGRLVLEPGAEWHRVQVPWVEQD